MTRSSRCTKADQSLSTSLACGYRTVFSTGTKSKSYGHRTPFQGFKDIQALRPALSVLSHRTALCRWSWYVKMCVKLLTISRAASSRRYMPKSRYRVDKPVALKSYLKAWTTGRESCQSRFASIHLTKQHLSLLLTCCHYSRPEVRKALTDSMVYHTLVILLHRPFVETAASPDTSVVTVCWSRCEEAAKNTTALLRRYRAAFSLARAPYLIVGSY